MGFLIAEHIALVENKYYRNAVGLGRSQEAVDECRAGLRTSYGNDQQRLVDIGSEDMALLREVDGLTDDVVLTILNFRNPVAFTHSDTVAHSHRISRADSLDAEIALYLTIKELVIVRTDGVPASGILNN